MRGATPSPLSIPGGVSDRLQSSLTKLGLQTGTVHTVTIYRVSDPNTTHFVATIGKKSALVHRNHQLADIVKKLLL